MASINTDINSQKTKISSFLSKQLKKGDTCYLVDSNWYKQWRKYVGYDSWETSSAGDASAHPGPVDNSPLLKPQTAELKENLLEERDYIVMPEEAWGLFMAWFGARYGQVALARKVIEHGMFVKHFKVEVYLMDLKMYFFQKQENIVKQFSRGDTIESIEMRMRKLFDIPEDSTVRLWSKYMSNTYEPLNIYKPDNTDNTVQDAGLYQGQVIVIETQNQDGTWSYPEKKLTSTKAPFTSMKSTTKQLQAQKIKVTEATLRAEEKAIDPSEEIITCIICFNVMSDPQMLPCQHTFCDRCVKQLKDVGRKQKQGVECPTCRQFCPRKDIQSSLVVKKMIEFHLKENKSRGEQYCKLHPSYKIEGRCIPCNTEICLKCKFDAHDVHPSESFDAAIKIILPQVTDKMSSISKYIEDIEKSISSLQESKNHLVTNSDRMKSQVQAQCNKLMADVDRSRKSAEKEINSKIELMQSAVKDHKQFISSREKTIGESENAGLLKVLQETENQCNEMGKNIGKKTKINLVELTLEKLTGGVQECIVTLEVIQVGD